MRVRITEKQNRFLDRLCGTTNMKKAECIRFCLNMTDSMLSSHMDPRELKEFMRDALDNSTLK